MDSPASSFIRKTLIKVIREGEFLGKKILRQPERRHLDGK